MAHVAVVSTAASFVVGSYLSPSCSVLELVQNNTEVHDILD
jgi:hypothetical protein